MPNLVVNSAVALRRFDAIVIVLVVISVLAIKTLRETQCQQVWALIEQGTCTWQETATCSAQVHYKATPYMATHKGCVKWL